MLKKRIIPCLDIKDGRTVKGINFLELKDAGDPVSLAKKYAQDGADELVFLDISATDEKRKTLNALVRKIALEINIPFTVGGGISTLEDAAEVIKSGADKISVNSAAILRPELVSEIANEFGSQCVVVAVDTKFEDGQWRVFSHGGKKPTGLLTKEWCKRLQELGAGEILLTSMNNDGTKSGFAIELVEQIMAELNIPVIASGGAGKTQHFVDVFQKTNVSAALAASVFHYGEIQIPDLKNILKDNKIAVR